MLKKVGINGFGSVGRNVFRVGHAKYPIVAINDLPYPIESLAHLLKYDSLLGILNKKVEAGKNCIHVGKAKVNILSYPEPAKIPWKKEKVDAHKDKSWGQTSKWELSKKFPFRGLTPYISIKELAILLWMCGIFFAYIYLFIMPKLQVVC